MTRILLVEDDETSRDVLSLRLTLKGYEVVCACDGAEALRMARGTDNAENARPELVLMDMNLPVMDGWTVTRRLREDPLTRGIPIIGVSAHAMTGDRERAIAAGCDDYETKPVEWLRLLLKIEALLARNDASQGH